MKRIIFALTLLLMMTPATALAKGSSSSRSSFSGSRSSSSSRVSSSSSKPTSSAKPSTKSTSTSSPKSTSTKPAPVPKTTASKPVVKPGSTIKTSSGKTVKTSTKKPTNAKYTREKGIVGNSGYSPSFRGGYSAPAGSVVYYQSHSVLDYLPWIYIFSQSSPRDDPATVVQPDGKEVKAEPVKEGSDGLLILNWIIMFLIGIGLIVGVVYLVNYFSNKNKIDPKLRHLSV